MAKTIKKFPLKKLIFWFSLLLNLAVLPILVYTIIFSGKIYPNINVSGKSLSRLTQKEAVRMLSEDTELPQKIKLTYQDQSFDLSTKNISLSYDFAGSVDRAYGYTRTGNIFLDIYDRFRLLIYPKNIGLTTDFDKDKLDKFVSVVSGQISVDPVLPSAKIINGKAVISNGAPGVVVDSKLLTAQIGSTLSNAFQTEIQIPTTEIDPKLTAQEMEDFQKRLDNIIGKTVETKPNPEVEIFDTFKYFDKDIIGLLNPKEGFDEKGVAEIAKSISAKIDRDPQNPKFNFNGGKVTEFLPAKDGVKVDVVALKDKIKKGIVNLSEGTEKTSIVDIPITRTPSEISTDKVNNLGIRELIGRGTSTYFHSIPTRIHNVSLATSQINGSLVKPGDTFSFNDALGDVSQFTGYQQAYIISEGKTILGDGGGVCQVSTTLFRALLNAGLPILERQAHAYRVGYYEQNSPPGLDATVYGPTPDLKFKNDTPNYILIEATADPRNLSLVFELYGTSDGRKSTISKPIVSNITPALPTVYQDDPTLPAGRTKQIDFSASGAKVTFNYTIERNGEEIYKKTFVSNYRPWAAVYLRGTGAPI